MRQTKILGLAFFATFVLSVMTSAAASAAKPEFSPVKVKFTTKGESSDIERKDGKKIECSTSTGSGEITAEKSGTFDLLLEGCKIKEGMINIKCTGLNDTIQGSILIKGTFDLRYSLLAAKHTVIVFLPEEFHFACAVVLIRVRGQLVCPIEPLNKKAKEFTITCKEEKGVNDFTEADNAENTKSEKYFLLASVAEEPFEQSGALATEKLTTEMEVEISA